MEQLSSPNDSREATLQALVRAMRWSGFRGALLRQAIAARLGLSLTDMECLGVLEDQAPVTAGQLAEVMNLTTGAITGVVDRLETAGYVTREADPSDRRRVILRPVAERLAESEVLYASLEQAMSRALTSYSDADLQLLLDFYRRADAAVEQEIGRFRAAERPLSGRELSAPLGTASEGRLEFANGASRVTIRGGQDPRELYRAAFEGAEPAVRVQDGSVTFRYRHFNIFDWGRQQGSVALNPAIPWTIALRGGASKVTVDARPLLLKELTLEGGASTVSLMLPPPRGLVSVRVTGGASKVDIRRPDGSPAQLQVSGGASRLEFDGQRFGAVGGELRLASPGWDAAADRYDIRATGGVSRLSVDTTQEERS